MICTFCERSEKMDQVCKLKVICFFQATQLGSSAQLMVFQPKDERALGSTDPRAIDPVDKLSSALGSGAGCAVARTDDVTKANEINQILNGVQRRRVILLAKD